MRRRDEDATVVEAFALPLGRADSPGGATDETWPVGKEGHPGRRAAQPALAITPRVVPVVDGRDGDPHLCRESEEGARLCRVGAEDHFILAWGRANAAVKSRGRQLLLSSCLNVVLAGGVSFLAWRNEHKETYVFVRDALGNVIQASEQGFLHAGDARTEAEIKGFMRRWVFDAYSWTPLDVEDRLRAALQVVESRAQPALKVGLGLAERKALVERGFSGRVHDGRGSGKEPQVVIARTTPLEIMVSFDCFHVDRAGSTVEAGHVFLRAHLKEVPRAPANPSGLMIVDTEISDRL
ncbi:MAG: hypothetical protein ABSB49_00475 [Polyangia bacterium]|jgi:hypothetical protein